MVSVGTKLCYMRKLEKDLSPKSNHLLPDSLAAATVAVPTQISFSSAPVSFETATSTVIITFQAMTHPLLMAVDFKAKTYPLCYAAMLQKSTYYAEQISLLCSNCAYQESKTGGAFTFRFPINSDCEGLKVCLVRTLVKKR